MKNPVYGIRKVANLGKPCLLDAWLHSYLQNHPDLIIIGKAGNMDELETSLPKLQDLDMVIFSTSRICEKIDLSTTIEHLSLIPQS